MVRKAEMTAEDRMKITSQSDWDAEAPKYGRVGAACMLLAGLFLLVMLVPWKRALPMIAKGWRYMTTGGRHIQMPGTTDHFPD